MKKIFRFLFSNLNFKILALMLTLVIWVIAGLFRVNKTDLTIPIEYVKLPHDLIITKTNTDQIKLIVEGRGSDFVKLFLTPPKYKLNLISAKYGTNRYRLIVDEIANLSPISVKSIVPEYSEIQTDFVDNKQIAISVPFRADNQKGIYITEITIQDTVMLFGPEAQIPFIKEISTESLVISGYSSPQVKRKLKLIVPDSKIYWTKPDSITIIASVDKEETKTIPNVPITISLPPRKKITVKPDSAQITIYGPATLVQALEKNDIKANIKIDTLTPGEYKIPAEIILPKGLFLTRCEPQLFEVRIK